MLLELINERLIKETPLYSSPARTPSRTIPTPHSQPQTAVSQLLVLRYTRYWLSIVRMLKTFHYMGNVGYTLNMLGTRRLDVGGTSRHCGSDIVKLQKPFHKLPALTLSQSPSYRTWGITISCVVTIKG